IVLTNAYGVCEATRAGKAPPNLHELELTLWATDGNGLAVPPTPGTYTMVTPDETHQPNGKFLLAHYATTGFHCVPDKIAGTRTGSRIELTRVAGGYSGSLDLTFDTGDHVSGSIDTQECETLIDFDPRMSCSE